MNSKKAEEAWAQPPAQAEAAKGAKEIYIQGLLLSHINQALNNKRWVQITSEEKMWIWDNCHRIVGLSDYTTVDFDIGAWKCTLFSREYIIILYESSNEILLAENEDEARRFIEELLKETA